MIKIFFVLSVLTFFTGCTSDKAREEVRREAKSTYDDVTPMNQYSRAISMVEADQGLTPTEKENLTQLIKDFAQKMQKQKVLQSRYRAILVRELLKSEDGRSPKVHAAREELQELNELGDEELSKFIRDFRFHAGESARLHQPTLIEVISR